METFRQTRRRCIAALIGLPLMLAGLWRFLSPRVPQPPELLRVPFPDLAHGSALVYRTERIALLREGDAIIALSLVCTHLGCTVLVTQDGMICPCHGSRFDQRGAVLSGPAPKALPRLRIEQQGNQLVIRG